MARYALISSLCVLVACSSSGSSSNDSSVHTSSWVEEPFQAITAAQVPVNAVATCQVLVVGGGTGGTAAALAAAKAGATVCISEETDWLGGQFTAQGLSCSDDSPLIYHDQSTALSASAVQFRSIIRAHYNHVSNPGGAWLSAFSAEPRACLDAIAKMTQPQVDTGRLRIFLGVRPAAVLRSGNQVTGVSYVRISDGATFQVKAQQVIDATELGDVLKLAGASYRIGQEPQSDTAEADAPVSGIPEAIQAITYGVVLERRPTGENHTIPKPAGYGIDPWMQGYSLGKYQVFDGEHSFFEWRRIRDASALGGKELAVINWSTGNDYWFGNILDAPPDQVDLNLAQARLRTLGFVYWLQTEAGGLGYPNLKIDTASLGTDTGLAKTPYIREARHLRALATIREEDVSSFYQTGSRAHNWTDSLGIGLYGFDLHRCTVDGSGTTQGVPLPFQVPLGALVPEVLDGLIAGAKNIGTTHLSSSAYRTHPVEWTIGEAAGTLASFCVSHGVQPRAIFASEPLTRLLQIALIDAGVPLYWIRDLTPYDPDWKAIQLVSVTGAIPGDSGSLGFLPKAPLTRAQCATALAAALHLAAYLPASPSFPDVPSSHSAYAAIEACMQAGWLTETPGSHFLPDAPAALGFIDPMVLKATGTRSFAALDANTLATRRQAAQAFASILRNRVNK